jgi:hypothetical protein
VLLGVLVGLVAVPAHAGWSTLDGTLTGVFNKPSGGDASSSIGFRGQLGLFFGEDPGIGGLVHYESLSSDTHASILGGGLRFGNRMFFEVGGGALSQTLAGMSEKGWALIAKPGFSAQLIGNWLIRISLSLVLKRASSSPAPHTSVEYSPFLGVAYPF